MAESGHSSSSVVPSTCVEIGNAATTGVLGLDRSYKTIEMQPERTVDNLHTAEVSSSYDGQAFVGVSKAIV